MKFCRIFLTLILLLLATPVFAYQTVVMDFQGLWYKVNYIQNERDAIVQFVRIGANLQNYNETVVFHTFKWAHARSVSAQSLMQSLVHDVQKRDNKVKIKYWQINPEDTLVSWCTEGTQTMQKHCEILRTTQSFEGPLSIHYINKNVDNFYAVQQDWLERISKARVYQSYFRLDRILNKAMTFEL